MRISIVTLFPALYEPFLSTSLVHRAVEAGQVSFSLENLFAHCSPKERVDSPTFGHNAGMLIKPEIMQKAIEIQEAAHGPSYKIFFSPAGKKLDQHLLKKLAHELQRKTAEKDSLLSQVGGNLPEVSQTDLSAGNFHHKKHIMLLPARYEGMDARIEEEYADLVISIGDYVLMGGDLPAMVLIEGLLRLIPGVVGKQESVDEDSFSGAFVDHPEYTAPVVWKGRQVPDIVRSGNHAEIATWRRKVAAEKSVVHHFNWVRSHVVKKEDIALAASCIPPHYVVLMHSQIMLKEGQEGTSSVTSLDIHDIARSAATYGLKKYFIVTPLEDQQKIVKKLLEFWQTEVGIDYNPHRHGALKSVILVETLEQALDQIEQEEKKKPLMIATSAKVHENVPGITYYDQEKVWSLGRPVVLLLGTARGLAPSLVERCDFLLGPIKGFSTFNHLSVRSAAAIIFDRWFGINLRT